MAQPVTYLLNSKGFKTSFKACSNPILHAPLTYWRYEEQLSICDFCNESAEWLKENIWRYPDGAKKLIRDLLELQEVVDTAEIQQEASEPSHDEEICVECGKPANFLNGEGLPICEKCFDVLVA